MHNERVLAPVRRTSLTLVALATAAALALSGCSSDSTPSGGSGSSRSASAGSSSGSPSASPTVPVPSGVALTAQGTRLAFGTSAVVAYEAPDGGASVLRLTVGSVRQGRLADFSGFILDDSYKRKASYYYARVAVQNLGKGDVGGVPVPVYGVNGSDTLLPPVSFTTPFATCPSQKLPATFGHGAKLGTCLVFLSPNHGKLVSLSYRPTQDFNPITWTGTVAKPAAPKRKAGKAGKGTKG